MEQPAAQRGVSGRRGRDCRGGVGLRPAWPNGVVCQPRWRAIAWDDDKSTAADPDNPSADEQLTATEWDNHVTDQKGRVPFGPVADRPAAGDASNGDVWLVTDLADDAGVLTKLVSGSWQIMGLGSASSPVPKVVTEQADITNETFVQATRGSDSSSTTAGTFINAYDGESEDNRDEFNSSAQFSPDKDGKYLVSFNPDLRGNTADGDTIRGRVRNTTDTQTVAEFGQQTAKAAGAGGGDAAPSFTGIANLNSAKTYELQVTNVDSSFVVSEFSGAGVIMRSVVA